MNKPKMLDTCYTCIHRREVGGSRHSSCAHPHASSGANPKRAAESLNVSGHPRGIAGGWFTWPYNFDPVWLESCDGYTANVQEAKG